MFACRCHQSFKFRMQGGVPVVYAREEDVDGCPWMGDHEGKGWRVFASETPPKLSQLDFEPRVGLKDFKRYSQRATHFVKKWREQLAGAEGGDPLREYPRRLAKAAQWWEEFLKNHRETFEQGEDEVTVVVDKPCTTHITQYLPTNTTQSWAPQTEEEEAEGEEGSVLRRSCVEAAEPQDLLR